MEILSHNGMLFLFRWIHFLAGIAWIGLLYYFNFVQAPFMAGTDPSTKSAATRQLLPRALWWFRWGAMFTFLSGLLMIIMQWSLVGEPWGLKILIGGTLGTFMWANVWFVIWPAQKVVIASAEQVAGGGQAIAEAAARGRRAFLASRTNTLFSIPMLFFMGAASHFPGFVETVGSWAGGYISALVLTLVVEANALMGSAGAAKKPLETVGNVITSGLILTLVLYVVVGRIAG